MVTFGLELLLSVIDFIATDDIHSVSDWYVLNTDSTKSFSFSHFAFDLV
jgi:hypothetical protein